MPVADPRARLSRHDVAGRGRVGQRRGEDLDM